MGNAERLSPVFTSDAAIAVVGESEDTCQLDKQKPFQGGAQ